MCSMQLLDSKRLVLKIGSALFVDPKTLEFNQPWFSSLINDIHLLIEHGIEVVIVTSGSLALGKLEFGIKHREISLESKQALCAVGQIKLIQVYQQALAEYNIKTAQVLLTLDDSEDRRRFLNARNTFETLLKLNVTTIVNENDTVATAEIRFGDNDRLAARVAQMINADTLVLLSDIDGLYTADPKSNPKAEFIPVVPKLTEKIMAMGQGSASPYGTGGMMTKLLAAKIANASGCRMLITSGKFQNPVRHFLDTARGTWFTPEVSLFSAKKAWLSEHLNPQGHLLIDAGATQALATGSSLLPIGIISVNGHFQKGDAVTIHDQQQTEIAKGLCNYSSQDLSKIIGHPSHEFFALLGYEGSHEAIHRDNLVLAK